MGTAEPRGGVDAAARSRAQGHPDARHLRGRPSDRTARSLRGAPPGGLPGGRAPGRRGGGRDAGLGIRRPDVPQRRVERGRGPAHRRMEHGPGSIRRDASGLLRNRGAGGRHGPGRRVGVALLPVAGLGLLWSGVLTRARRCARPGVLARVQRLAPQRVGGTASRADHSAAAAVAGRRRAGGVGAADQRRPRIQGGELPRVPGPARLALHLQRAVGSLLRRLRRDGHRGVPAHRGVGLGAAAVPRPAVRIAPHPVPGQRPPGRRRVAVVRGAIAVPRAQDRAVRRRHRLGPHADGPRRLRRRPLRIRSTRAPRGPPRCCRARCCDATSGSAPSTTRQPSCSAM